MFSLVGLEGLCLDPDHFIPNSSSPMGIVYRRHASRETDKKKRREALRERDILRDMSK